MDNKSTTKRMIGAVVLVLIAALLLAWLLKGKNQSVQEQQELIADQTTQGSTPILGFPGVKEGEEAAQEGDAPYVIGDADAKQDGTAAQQQGDLTAQAADGADAGATDGATGTGAAVIAGAATAGKEAVQSLANNFQVRDSDEQRQVVGDGKAKAGTGSMGSSELALPKKGDTDTDTAAAAGGDATQQQAQTQTTEAADNTAAAAPEAPAQQTQTASTGSGSATQDAKPAKQKKPVASNVKLVGEKAVPAPRSQSKKVASSSASKKKAKVSSASGSSSSASQTAAGGKGYAIQVLAASSRNKAEQVRKSISVDGYPVFVVKANVNGKTVYRVRVGTYPARNAARSVQTKMKARYTKNQYVQNSFVTKN